VLPVPDAIGTRGTALPDEVVERAASRLRLTAAVTLGVSFVRVLIGFLSESTEVFGSARESHLKLVFFAIGGVFAAILLAVSYARLPPRRFLLLGQVFFIVLVAIFGATETTAEWGEHPFARGIPMPVAVLLVVPVVVPMPPRRYLIVALLAIATNPIVMLAVPPLVGHAPPSTLIVLLQLIPLVMAAFVAYLTAHVIYRMGRDLGRAQKMGRYQLVAPLGKGGMGEVWRAKHGMLAREAAVKLIRRDRGERGSDEALKRLEHEARVEPEAPSLHAKTPVPPELDAVILKCLAKRREDRPPDAEALATALKAVPLATPWTRERALAWWASHGAGPGAEASSKAAAIADTRVADRGLSVGCDSR